MNPDNPFGDIADTDKTVRMARAKPATTAGRSGVATRPSGIGEIAEAAFAVAAANPLVGAASPLLWLVSRLGGGADPQDVDGLQERIIADLRRFETNALTKGIAPETVRLARYVLCATLDDVVMNTDWGSHGGWPSRTLVSTLYSEALGGERFFDILSQLMGDPNANIDLLELMAICIGIGFVGKYRVMAAGMPQLARLRDDLHRTLRRVRGSYERDLSTDWRGLPDAHKPPPSPRSMWIVAGLAVLFLLGLYAVFAMTLRAQTDVVIDRLNALVPAKPVTPAAIKPALPSPPSSQPVPPPMTQMQRIEAGLRDSIAAGVLQVVATERTITIRISGRALFASGKDVVVEQSLPMLRQLARTVAAEAGPIQVVGHADKIPMRGISNQELSRLRAEAVRRILADSVAPTRLSVEAHGDHDPIADNATGAGRERNRRVEVLIPRTDSVP